jgi:hypothetical protein
MVDGEGLGPGGIGGAGMDHHRGVQPVEGAAVEHENLPASAFLGGVPSTVTVSPNWSATPARPVAAAMAAAAMML